MAENIPYQRTTPEKMAERGAQIREFLAQNMTVREMAERLGVEKQRIYSLIRTNENMILPSRRDLAAKCGPIAATRPALRRQDDGFLQWLIDSKPEGVTVTDFLISCAVDAYLDETQPETALAA